jgi:hypothetical protein
MATVGTEPGFYLRMDATSTFNLAWPELFTATDIYSVSNDGSSVFDLQGSFAYNLDGSLASGVITGVAEYAYQGTVLAGSVTGLNIDVSTFLDHLGLDPTFEAIFQGILGGGDVIEGGNGGPNRLYGFGGGGDTIIGGHSNDVLIGYGGNNYIRGYGIHDWIDGGPGLNGLAGGSKATTFAFFSSDNLFADYIGNFKPGTPAIHDVLELHSLPGLRNYHQVQKHEFVYQGDVTIYDNIGDYIFLGNIHHKAQLHPYDFHFLA